MLKNLGIDLDLKKVGKEYKVQLALPNKTIKQNIKNLKNVNLDNVKINELASLSFEIPHKVENRIKGTDEIELINNPDIKNIKEEMLIKLTWYNNERTSWFKINNITQTDNQDEVSMKVEAEALPSELRSSSITVDFTAVDIREYFTAVLEQSAWKLGTISSSLEETFRSFDEAKKTRYEAIQDGIETYGAVLDWDEDKRVLNLVGISELRKFRGVVLKKENYMSSLEIQSSSEEIVTRLYVYGNEELTIQKSNPTGMAYIEDFSYFIAPFERDVNKNVLSHSYYMSDDLCHAILDLIALQEEYNPKIKTLQDLLNSAYADLSQAMIDMADLEGQMITLEALLDTAKSTNDADLIYQRSMEIRDKQAEIDEKQEDIDNINLSITTWEDTIVKYQAIISTATFTQELQDELKLFVYEKEFSDDRYIDDIELYEAGVKEFQKYQVPVKSFTVELASFINSIESQKLHKKLLLGEEVEVKSTNLDSSYRSIILGYDVALSDGDYNLSVSDNMDDIDSMDKLATLIYNASSASTVLTNNKYKWDNVTDVQDEVTQWRTEEIKTVNKRIVAGANESITIDNRGIKIRNPDFPDEQIIIQSGVVALSKDAGETWSTSITPNGVVAETIIGKILAGNNLIITNENGSFVIDSGGLTVDMDSIHIMSGESGTPEDMVAKWNSLLLTYDEITNDNMVNEYEKKQLFKQWTQIVDINSSMIKSFLKGWGDSTEDKPTEYNDYLTAYEALRIYLNETKQSDGYALLADENITNTTEIDSDVFIKKFSDYETTKQALESIISLEFTKSQILVLEEGISLQYVKNENVVTQLNLSEEGVKIDGKLLEINSDTEFNANLTMNAGVIKGKDDGIIIDLNAGTMTLNKPLTIGTGSNVVVTEDLEKLKEQYTVMLDKDTISIPTDEDGNNGTYVNANSTISVYKMGVDDSSKWTITAVQSDGVVGSLSGRKFTVTNMTTDSGTITFTAKNGEMVFTKVFTLSKSKTGVSGGEGTSAITLVIQSSNGYQFKNSVIDTTLTAILYQNNSEIDADGSLYAYIWTKTDRDGNPDNNWNLTHQAGSKSISITQDDVARRATFNCSVYSL